jgi:hypothetical protein
MKIHYIILAVIGALLWSCSPTPLEPDVITNTVTNTVTVNQQTTVYVTNTNMHVITNWVVTTTNSAIKVTTDTSLYVGDYFQVSDARITANNCKVILYRSTMYQSSGSYIPLSTSTNDYILHDGYAEALDASKVILWGYYYYYAIITSNAVITVTNY